MGVSLSDTGSDTLVSDTDLVDDTLAWGVHNTDRTPELRTHPCPRDDHHLRHSCDADHRLGEEDEQHDCRHDGPSDDG